MADGPQTNDAAHKAADHPAANTAAADSHSKLLADSLGKPDAGKDNHQPAGDKAAPKADAGDAGDKKLDHIRDNISKTAGDAYGHLGKAQAAANEIAGYVKANRKEDEVITVTGPDGKPKTEKVSERVSELKKIVDTECATAVGSSNKIDPKDAALLVQNARNDRNNLAKELGLDPNKMSKEAIVEARKGTTDSANAAKFDQLAAAQTKLDNYKTMENAPAYTRMLYASFKGSGLTDPESGMKRDANGALKTNQKDVLDAVQLLAEAGSNKELRNSRLYIEATSKVMPQLENGSERTRTITKDLEDAIKAGAAGNKTEQERLLKDAVTQADQTNTAAIAQMLRDPRFVNSQIDQKVVSDMATSAVMGNTARLQYAQFLADQGKFQDAQGLVLRVKAELPEVMYAQDPKNPGQLTHAQSRFVDLDKLDRQVTASTNANPQAIKNMLDDFNTAMSKGQIVTKGGAHEIMDELKAASAKAKTEVADGQKGIEDAQKVLDQRKKDFEAKTFLTDESKAIEKAELDREAMLIQRQKEVLAADAVNANHLSNVVKLYDASLDVAEEHRDSARAKLAEVKRDDPSLATEKTDGKDSFYTQLSKAAEEPGWWDRNWRKVAYGAAIAAGAVAGLATIWTGPGAALVAGGTTVGLMGAFGLSVGAGAIAGAGTFLGTHEILNKTGAVKEQVNVLSDLKQGASGGALGAFMFASTPLMAAAGSLGAAGATGAAVEGVAATSAVEGTAIAAGTAEATTASATMAAQVNAITWGTRIAQGGRLAAVTFGGAAANEGVDAWAQGHSLKQAAGNIAMYSAFPMVGALGGGLFKGAKAAIGIEAAAPALYQAPKIMTFSTAAWGLGQTGLVQYMSGRQDKALADQMGADYAYGSNAANGYVGQISQATSLFGPYGNTRGWEASRQSADDYTGENSIIQQRYTSRDPGLDFKDRVTRTTDPSAVQNMDSDFTDASKLTNPPAGN